MTTDENKLEILKKVENGTLSVEEGADLIGILDRAVADRQSAEITDHVSPKDNEPGVEQPNVSGCWKAAWSMILAGGAILTAFSAYWIYQGYQKAGLSWGFWLSWIPFMLGLLFTILGWIIMESPWLHVRVRSNKASRISNFTISIPLPLRLAKWVIHNFGQYLPQDIKEKGLENLLEEVDQTLQRGEPFQIDVDDSDDESQVSIRVTRS